MYNSNLQHFQNSPQYSHSYAGTPPQFYGSQYMKQFQQQYLAPHAYSVQQQILQQQCIPSKQIKSMSVSPSTRQRKPYSAKLSTKSSSRMSLQAPASWMSLNAPSSRMSLHSPSSRMSERSSSSRMSLHSSPSSRMSLHSPSSRMSQQSTSSRMSLNSSSSRRSLHASSIHSSSFAPSNIPSEWASTVGQQTEFHTAAGSQLAPSETWAPSEGSQWLPSEDCGNSQWDALSSCTLRDNNTVNYDDDDQWDTSSVHTMVESTHLDTMSGVPTIVETNSQWEDVSVSTLHRLSSTFDEYSDHSASHSSCDYSDDELSQVY